jgi:hypothetical protein
MSKSHSYRFTPQLSNKEIGRYYQGTVCNISVRADNGKQLRFATRHLRPFITGTGIQLNFLLPTDKNNQFQSLKKTTNNN